MKKLLGIILARGGSKGIPNKNLKKVNKKPLIEWTINAALKSKFIDDIIISTDSKKIANFGIKKKIEIPFIRPSSLATDSSPSYQSILHAIKFLEKKGRFYKNIILLEPTSPLRDSNDIDMAFKKMNNLKATALTSVCKLESTHPDFLYSIKNKKIKPYKKKSFLLTRRQDLTELFYLEGSIYLSNTEIFKKKKSFYHSGTIAYIMPKWKSLEIDDYYDLFIAENLLKSKINYK